MTLFPASPLLRAVLLAVTLVPGTFATAAARDGVGGSTVYQGISVPMWKKHHRQERRDWRERRRDERTHRHLREDRGRKDRGGNFYGGAISAWRDPGNGTYFYFDRGDVERPAARRDARANPGKVIRVLPGNDGCSWEAGVCVVRPNP